MSDTYPQPASGVSDSLLSSAQTWCLKALTPIWTGDAERKGERLILTGLLGSLRWWFEVLVRGLGGSAYDSTEEGNPCPDPKVKNATEPLHHCVVCELFGCTGWARKFRFQAFDSNGNVQRDQIKKNQDLKLRFILLRPIRREEWALLELTLRLIADYGGIGGRTVFKPSDENSRANAPHHRDYGLVKLLQGPPTAQQINRKTLEDYVRSSRWRRVDHDDFAWASLQNFWCVKGRHLTREGPGSSSFNKVIGRNESKACRDCGNIHDPPQRCQKTRRHPRRYSESLLASSAASQWLAGRQRESKKVFSFKEPAEARRTFGFVKPGTLSFDQMKQRLRPDLKDADFKTGEAILEALFQRETGDRR
jgi:CRISPR-associated protein Cmr1